MREWIDIQDVEYGEVLKRLDEFYTLEGET